jgi:alginate O-acetyltransferase complex protein AlgI
VSLDSAFFLLCFLPLAAILYHLLRGGRAGNVLLLALSLLFCAFGSLSSLALLLAAALVNYVFGRLILRFPGGGKALAALAVALDLAFLGAFKYLGFLLSLILPLRAAEWGGLGIVAPLGISFFTFKCISYIIDTRRDPACGTRSFFRLLLYISFSPSSPPDPSPASRNSTPSWAHGRPMGRTWDRGFAASSWAWGKS